MPVYVHEPNIVYFFRNHMMIDIQIPLLLKNNMPNTSLCSFSGCFKHFTFFFFNFYSYISQKVSYQIVQHVCTST